MEYNYRNFIYFAFYTYAVHQAFPCSNRAIGDFVQKVLLRGLLLACIRCEGRRTWFHTFVQAVPALAGKSCGLDQTIPRQRPFC